MNQKETEQQIRRLQHFFDRAVREIVRDTAPFEITFAHTTEHLSFEQRLGLTYRPIVPGETWGHRWDSGWFKLVGTVPNGWRGNEVVAQLDFGGEGLVFSPDGRIMQGVTNGSVFVTEFGRDIVRLAHPCTGGEKIELWVEAASSGLFGMFCDLDPTPKSTNRYGYYDAKLNMAHLGLFDREMWGLTLDLRVLLGLIKTLPEKGVRRARIIHNAIEGLNAYARSGDDPTVFREIIDEVLSKPAVPSSLSVTAVGHAHIDTAWLWPVEESIRKCARTFSTQLDLIDRYPDYIFGASQAQHYQFVLDRYPALYDRIKKAVKDGRWEIQGGMWVEADCNIPSGESLVRQILHGKNFFKDEFGVEVDNLWLPDVFGYSAALPQILKKSGIDYFLTQKLSWSQFNDFPHHTFNWQGIDGTAILTHFPPEDTYNSQLEPNSLVPGQDKFKERDYIDEFISLFGVGDGGGGPKEEHIELGLRQKNLEGSPKVRFGSASDFFQRLNRHAEQVPTWVGELYLELHRGTFTTQAFVKWANRRLEQKLRALEFLCSALPLDEYPQAELDRLWKTVLLHQFHDIIPGSSITRQYQSTNAAHRAALAECDSLMAATGAKVCAQDSAALTLFNPSHYKFDGPLPLPDDKRGRSVTNPDGRPCPIQSEGDQTVVRVVVPPYSFVTLVVGESTPPPQQTSSELVLENDLVRYEFGSEGTLISCLDKETGRDIVVPDNPGNLLTLYEDRPNDWDAWDVDPFYRDAPLETAALESQTPLISGPVRKRIGFEFSIGQSHLRQQVSLPAGSKRLDFETTVDWREKHKMLRVSFPVTISSESASFDIQYGFLRRSTHQNTSWEKAKFEVVGHRYADISDNSHGAALLNDCKYGYHVEDGLLDLNLLRSPNYPDPDADQGEHHFTYSFLPHAGDLVHSNVMAEAALLNQGLILLPNCRIDEPYPISLEGEGLSLEVVKKAEKENCLILRIVETNGDHSTGTLNVSIAGAKLRETNLMEWIEEQPISLDDPLQLQLTPFEIRTYKLALLT